MDLKNFNKEWLDFVQSDKILQMLMEETKTTENIESLEKQIEERQNYLTEKFEKSQ